MNIMLMRHWIIVFFYEEISQLQRNTSDSLKNNTNFGSWCTPLVKSCISHWFYIINMIFTTHLNILFVYQEILQLKKIHQTVLSTSIKFEAITVIIILCCYKIFSWIAMIISSKATIKCFFSYSVKLSMFTE